MDKISADVGMKVNVFALGKNMNLGVSRGQTLTG